MAASAAVIWMLLGWALWKLLDEVQEPIAQRGLFIFAAALGLCVGLLAWVLFRQISGRYEWQAYDRNARLQETNTKLKELSMTDSLTGLYNRRFFDEHFRIEFFQSRRTSRPLAVLLIDLDDFKQINDRYGHAGGDQVLQGVAKTLKDQIRRGGDFIARYGGEEFVVLLPETSSTASEELAQRIVDKIRSNSIFADGEAMHVTASIGMAATDEFYQALSELDLLKAADQALYRAKGQGKNKAVLARYEAGDRPGEEGIRERSIQKTPN